MWYRSNIEQAGFVEKSSGRGDEEGMAIDAFFAVGAIGGTRCWYRTDRTLGEVTRNFHGEVCEDCHVLG
jgi:hypothetical protein